MFKQPTLIEIDGKVGKEQTLSFYYDDKISLITRLETPCTCSDPRNIPNERKIEVKYKPVDVPIHLKQEGKTGYTSTKIIKVEYDNIDGTKGNQDLIFMAHITE